MKKCMTFLFVLAFFFTACEKNYTFKGIDYQFERAEIISKNAVSLTKLTTLSTSEYYSSPIAVKVAFSRIMSPCLQDADAIFQSASQDDLEIQEIPINESDYSNYLDSAIVACNRSTDNPLVIDINNAELITLDTNVISDEARFWGIVLQTVYFEFEMSDFMIRWYCNDCTPYLAKDVLISQDNGHTWKFAYNQVHVDTTGGIQHEEYSLGLFDMRQDDLFLDSKWDAGVAPYQDTLMHLCIFYEEDWNAESAQGGSLSGNTALMTFGKTSTSQAGGGFGRLDNDITGFSIIVMYEMGNDSCCTHAGGLQLNFPPAQSGTVHFSDMNRSSDFPKSLYPIKQLLFEVNYQIQEEVEI